MPTLLSVPGPAALLVSAAVLLATGCQDPASRRNGGAAAPDVQQAEATVYQDSMATLLSPGRFRARLLTNPSDTASAAAGSPLHLDGSAAFDPGQAQSGQSPVLRILLAAEANDLALEIMPAPQPGSDTTGIAGLYRPGVYEHQLQVRPSVRATLRTGRRTLNSRSGTVTLEQITEDRIVGRFYFEMQPPDEETGDGWFSLAGVFDAVRTGQGP